MRFKIDWASLIVGRKFTVFALFYFVFEGTFQAQTSRGAYRKIPKISPGAYIFQRPFLRGLFLEGLIFGGAYFRNFTVSVLTGCCTPY